HVTGHSAIEAVQGIGNGRIACFTSAPGSAGTLAAGDAIKEAFPEAKIAALEPYECSTLTDGGRGQHRIEGIGDKMCTLIHNVLTTDFVVQIKDDDCVRGLKVLHDGAAILVEMGVKPEIAEAMKDLFGVSGVCNILGAIKMAKHLRLGPGDNVVTIATDGYDRYDSVLTDLRRRVLEIEPFVLRRWARDIFLKTEATDIADYRSWTMKEKLFAQKEQDWLPFGYSKEYLEAMKKMNFWDDEYAKIREYDARIIKERSSKS
ncbi:MAG TPA: hypothetical protein P5154_02395, partial [Candidatus Izemoplasmatales bacterium]|nr:hypothetical protein [Candidatus Izemoplasmatales bacterium]